MSTTSKLSLLTREPRTLPVKVLQFGEGNFLRGFVDWMFNRLNAETDFQAGVHVVQPHGSNESFVLKQLKKQNHAYTVLLRGLKDGERSVEDVIVDNIVSSSHASEDWGQMMNLAEGCDLRFVVSNTTEAGIVYEKESFDQGKCPKTFPAKVTAFLYRRFTHFSGDPSKGLLFLPCELIESNGQKLKTIILQIAEDWNLGSEFMGWIHSANHFSNTLVDRIVPGFPGDEIDELCEQFGYQDDIVVCGEPYHLWAIEGDPIFQKELPFAETDMNVVFTDDLSQYRSRKVKVLNGVHTMSVLLSHLMGIETVKDTLENELMNAFIKQGAMAEIAPTIAMAESDKLNYIEGVMERFANPFVRHLCLSISLNSVSKFKVRVLPTLLESLNGKGEAPKCLCLALAALIRFYKVTHRDGDRVMGTTVHGPYPIQDDAGVMDKMELLWNNHNDDIEVLSRSVLEEVSFWGEDLSVYPSIVDHVKDYLGLLVHEGPEQAIKVALGIK